MVRKDVEVPDESDHAFNGRAWEQLYDKLGHEVPGQFFDIFFKDIYPMKWNQKTLTLASNDKKILSHIKNRYAGLITGFARELSNPNLKVNFQYKEGLKSSVKENPSTPVESYRDQRPPTKKQKEYSRKQLNFFQEKIEDEPLDTGGFQTIYVNKNYTFDRFIKGPSNEHALAAAMGIAKNPMQYHNPLYLFGGVGLGKTHLLMSIANKIQVLHPWMKVAYVPSETFQNDLVQATASNSLPQFKAKYRNVDVFLIDDIQFISHRAEFTQETIFHTFNYLYQLGKQIVISGDRPPQQLSMLKDRLISRFQSGLIVDIKPPNLETREAILITKTKEMNMKLPADVVKHIALNVVDQIRFLEAVLIRLKFSLDMENKSPTIGLAKDILMNIQGENAVSGISVDDILKTVAKHFRVSIKDIKGKSRMEAIALSRHACMFLIRKLIPSMSLISVAELVGRKDHTTVINAEKRIVEKMDKDESLRLIIQDIETEFKN